MTLIFIEGNLEFYIVVYVLATVDQWRSHADLGSYVSCEYGRCPNVIFTVTRTKDAETKYKFYKKKAKKPLFIHHQFALPKRTKINTIRNDKKRIKQRCSRQT